MAVLNIRNLPDEVHRRLRIWLETCIIIDTLGFDD